MGVEKTTEVVVVGKRKLIFAILWGGGRLLTGKANMTVAMYKQVIAC